MQPLWHFSELSLCLTATWLFVASAAPAAETPIGLVFQNNIN